MQCIQLAKAIAWFISGAKVSKAMLNLLTLAYKSWHCFIRIATLKSAFAKFSTPNKLLLCLLGHSALCKK